MIKKTVLLTLLLVSMSSCVSKKIYNDLENKYTDLKKENHNLADENEELKKAKNLLETDKASLESELAKLKSERDKLQTDCAATANNLKTLQASYNALEKNSNDALESISNWIRSSCSSF
jgi:chemotaxis protein MotB